MMQRIRQFLNNLFIKAPQVTLSLALFSVGLLISQDDAYFRYPPDWTWLMNSDLIGAIGICAGMGLFFWAGSGFWNPVINGWLLIASVFFWASILTFEGFHDWYYQNDHGYVAFMLVFIMLLHTFVLILKTDTKGK